MNKNFQLIKKQALGKLDKSFIGKIDEKILPLCNIINSKENLFTLSSCSGRFSINKVQNFKKIENCWVYTTHNLVNIKDLNFLFTEKTFEDDLELRCEAMILHICVENLNLALKILHEAKNAGCNQVGIISIKNKIVVELICSAKLITPIYIEKLLINKEYLEILINQSNKILKKSWETINNLEEVFNRII